MPTYEYSCETCSSLFDFDQSFSEDSLTKCPGKRKGGPVTDACKSPGKGKVAKVFGAVGIAFKGDGFYKNDHGAGAKSKNASTAADSSSSSSGSDSSSSSDGSSTDSKKSDTKKSESTKSESTKSDSKKKSSSAKAKSD